MRQTWGFTALTEPPSLKCVHLSPLSTHLSIWSLIIIFSHEVQWREHLHLSCTHSRCCTLTRTYWPILTHMHVCAPETQQIMLWLWVGKCVCGGGIEMKTQTGWLLLPLLRSKSISSAVPSLACDVSYRSGQSFLLCSVYVNWRRARWRRLELRHDCPSSLLVGDAPLPGGQHVVEGVSADAGPGKANQRTIK